MQLTVNQIARDPIRQEKKRRRGEFIAELIRTKVSMLTEQEIWFPMSRSSLEPSTFYATLQPLGYWSAIGFCTTLGLVCLYFSFKKGRRYGDAPTDSVVTWVGLPLAFIFWYLCAIAKIAGVMPHW